MDSCCAPIGCLRRRCATWAAGPHAHCADARNYDAHKYWRRTSCRNRRCRSANRPRQRPSGQVFALGCRGMGGLPPAVSIDSSQHAGTLPICHWRMQTTSWHLTTRSHAFVGKLHVRNRKVCYSMMQLAPVRPLMQVAGAQLL